MFKLARIRRLLKDCNEAIQRNPRDATAYCNRGNAWCLKGNFASAIRDYTEAIQLVPHR